MMIVENIWVLLKDLQRKAWEVGLVNRRLTVFSVVSGTSKIWFLTWEKVFMVIFWRAFFVLLKEILRIEVILRLQRTVHFQELLFWRKYSTSWLLPHLDGKEKKLSSFSWHWKMEGKHKLLFFKKGKKRNRENLMEIMRSLCPLSLKSYFGRDGWITSRGKVKKERS